ncbi:MAG: hypothetical protein GXZ13_01820 [Synergistaceae bacterium]|nr:hypothetical protein [Synergistaceae bacterium]
MEKGLIQSGRTIFWSRKKKKLFFLPDPTLDDIKIAGGMNGCVKEANLCKSCNKIVVDIADE